MTEGSNFVFRLKCHYTQKGILPKDDEEDGRDIAQSAGKRNRYLNRYLNTYFSIRCYLLSRCLYYQYKNVYKGITFTFSPFQLLNLVTL